MIERKVRYFTEPYLQGYLLGQIKAAGNERLMLQDLIFLETVKNARCYADIQNVASSRLVGAQCRKQHVKKMKYIKINIILIKLSFMKTQDLS